MTVLLIGVVIGLFGGFYIGRWRAELGRGRADATRAWNGRRDYRK